MSDNNVTRRAMLSGALLSPLTLLLNEAQADEKSVWTEEEVCEKLNAVLEQYEKSLEEGYEQAYQAMREQERKFILQCDVEGGLEEAILQGDPAGLVKEPTERTLAARRLILFQQYIVECARYRLCLGAPEPNEKLMRSVEAQLGIPEQGVCDFRRSLLSCYGAYVLSNVYGIYHHPHEDNNVMPITPSLLCPRFHEVMAEEIDG